jgi:hypothetical protein
MIELPKGSKTLEDYQIIDQLIKDPIFIQSVEADLGSVIRIFPVWSEDRMYYELLDGSTKVAKVKLTDMVKKLKDMNYMRDFFN